jgi:membrane-associated phospholipid phosphatase
VTDQKHTETAPTTTANSRRGFLGKLGMAGAAGVVAPTLLNLPSSTAHAVAILPGGNRSRMAKALDLRSAAALRNATASALDFPVNGDDETMPTLSGNFSKALRHNERGEADLGAYLSLLKALSSGTMSDFASVQTAGSVKLANPQAALAFQLEGMDSNALAMPAPPKFSSAVMAGEMIELYWHALLRDLPFSQYASDPLAQAAVSDLRNYAGFTNTTSSNLFRGDTVGDMVGPYISQLLVQDIPYGAHTIAQRYQVPVAADDFMTDYTTWLAIQNGAPPSAAITFDGTQRYLRNGRDLGEYVHRDFPFQAFINAALILLAHGGAALDDGNPYKSISNQGGFITFGASDILTTVAKAADCGLKAAWFQKWQVHRRVRPEEFAGYAENERRESARYGIHPSLRSSDAYTRILQANGNVLLPMAFAEGCPTHPAYPAGHATISGACATVLKAFFKESFVLPNPRQASVDGLSLNPVDSVLTLGGELDKLAANISLGRDIAGVHWRSDGIEGLHLGEQVGIALLQDLKANYNESFSGFELQRFDGRKVTI